MDARMAALCAEYNEARSVIYGLSVNDYIALREQCNRENGLQQVPANIQVSPVAETSFRTGTVPAKGPEAPAQRTREVKTAANITPVPSRQAVQKSELSELEILKSLGE